MWMLEREVGPLQEHGVLISKVTFVSVVPVSFSFHSPVDQIG